MKDIKGIDSVPDPRKKTGDKNSVNPDKFQKALKVEKSDETDKREKRNRPRKQEELDDEQDDASASIPVPNGLFKEYMSEEEKKASALDLGEGKGVHLVSDDAGAPSSAGLGFIPDSDANAPSAKISVTASDNVSDAENPAESEDESVSNTQKSTAPPQGYTENIKTPQRATSSKETQQPKETSSTDKKKKVEQKKKPTPKKKVEKEARTTPKKAKEKIVTSDAKETTAAKKTTTAKEESTKSSSFSPHVEHKKEIKNSKETADSSSITAPKEISEQKSSTKDHQEDGNKDDVIGVSEVAPLKASNMEALQTSPFANIPKDVFELFEKMVGMMQVSKDNGKSITTVKLNMPNSVFDKCELVLEHYDTAPNNYTVQFLGNPAAVERFAQNLPALNNAIAESKLTFSIHLPPPKLAKVYAAPVSSLEKEKGDKEEESDREEKEK